MSMMAHPFTNLVPTSGSNATYTLSQFRAKGFERHSSVSRGRNIFQNRTTYTLLPRWTTAGRYRDTVGPRYSVAQILNANRYGPGALGTGSPPVITQEPQNQTVSVGSTATFSIQVNGSGLFYQWQRSNDGGSTWIPAGEQTPHPTPLPRPHRQIMVRFSGPWSRASGEVPGATLRRWRSGPHLRNRIGQQSSR